MNRRWVFLAGLLAGSALLAFVLQGVLWDTLVVPVYFRLWLFWHFLRSIPQWVYWNLLVAGVVLAALKSLAGRRRVTPAAKEKSALKIGPVAAMANEIRNNRRSTFFQWIIAHELAGLARAILVQRAGQEAIPRNRLAGQDWNPPAEIQAYLESGLNSRLLDLPRKGFFFRPGSTVLDVDLRQVVDYLESQMEI